MKTYSPKPKRVRPRFAPPKSFTVEFAPAAPFRGELETELEQLKVRLLMELLADSTPSVFHTSIRQAMNDAAALAWTTSYPLLVLPELVREKAESARGYVKRQAAMLERSRLVETGRAA